MSAAQSLSLLPTGQCQLVPWVKTHLDAYPHDKATWLSMNLASLSYMTHHPEDVDTDNMIVVDKVLVTQHHFNLYQMGRIKSPLACKTILSVHPAEQVWKTLNWEWISLNPVMYDVLVKYQDKVKLCEVSRNTCPKVMDMVYEWMDTTSIPFAKFDWHRLSANPAAIKILTKYPEWINWPSLSMNPAAITMLEQNQDKIDWSLLSLNPNAMHLMEANQDKINWTYLSENPSAIHLLEQNQNKIDWYKLSTNPNAMHLLEANQDKIKSGPFMTNPSIFTYDYTAIKTTLSDLHLELIAVMWHPGMSRFYNHEFSTSYGVQKQASITNVVLSLLGYDIDALEALDAEHEQTEERATKRSKGFHLENEA
jgi:hypothetical protein